MVIRPLTNEWLDPARDLYNMLTRRLPHCFPAGRSEFREAMEAPPELANAPLQFAAIEGDWLQGFAFGSVCDDSDGPARVAEPGDGLLTGLYCRSSAAAEALISAALRHLGLAGAARFVAFDAGESRNHLRFFNSGFPACSETLAFVPQSLARSGFVVATRELHLTRDLICEETGPPSHLKSPPGIGARWISDHPALLELHAMRRERAIARCEGRLLQSRLNAAAARSRGYIQWLGVDPEFQGRGIGRFLLREMLRRMALLGMKQVFLTTGSQNWRAQPLYYSEGFVLAGTSITMIKDTAPRSSVL